MTWHVNFCAPMLNNDPTINFYRYVQGALLMIYLIITMIVHTYYKFWGPLPIDDDKMMSSEEDKKNQRKSESDQNQSESNYTDQEKEVSIKLEEHHNQSCVQLKKTATTWGPKTIMDSGSQKFHSNVTVLEIQDYTPVITGQFALIMGISILYTPFFQQTFACILFMILTIPLLKYNAKRYVKTTRAFWTMMVVLLMFILSATVLEIGQSNWDDQNATCFSEEYVSIYE